VLKPHIKVKLAELEKKQVDVAGDLNIKQQRLSNWVRGRGYPDLNEAFRLAKYLDCTVDDLWEYKEE